MRKFVTAFEMTILGGLLLGVGAYMAQGLMMIVDAIA
jgi:hypothetical protein